MPSTATGQKIGNLFVAIALCVAGLPLCAADVAGRRMVWAHYVPWYTPDNASQMSHRFHSYPQEDVGANPFREEIDRVTRAYRVRHGYGGKMCDNIDKIVLQW